MIIFETLKRIWSLIAGSKTLWNFISHYGVITEALKAIEDVLKNIAADKSRKLPTQEEAIILTKALSNILKSGVIDIPGVDEYEIAMNLDMVASHLSVSINDKKSGTFIEIPALKKTGDSQ